MPSLNAASRGVRSEGMRRFYTIFALGMGEIRRSEESSMA
jgi:hypothetical protein